MILSIPLFFIVWSYFYTYIQAVIHDPCKNMTQFWITSLLFLLILKQIRKFSLIPFIFSSLVNIFCGSQNCYDILGVPVNSTIKDIKKSYRKLSLTHHPDKSKDANATENFRFITKAFEVLTGNESRPLFDYYLAHPRVSLCFYTHMILHQRIFSLSYRLLTRFCSNDTGLL